MIPWVKFCNHCGRETVVLIVYMKRKRKHRLRPDIKEVVCGHCKGYYPHEVDWGSISNRTGHLGAVIGYYGGYEN